MAATVVASRDTPGALRQVLFCDMPDVTGAIGGFIPTGMANVVDLEAGLISERTKAGLVRNKKRPGTAIARHAGHYDKSSSLWMRYFAIQGPRHSGQIAPSRLRCQA